MGRKKKSDDGVDKIKKRVEALVKERPSHKEILEFFKDILAEQYTIRSKIKTAPVEIEKEEMKVKMTEGFPLVEKRALTLDVPLATRLFRRLCKIMGRDKKASPDVERINKALRNKDIDLIELFKQANSENGEYVSTLAKKLKVKEDILAFLARNSIKPIFEAYANDLKGYVDQKTWWRGYCPICGSEPFLAEFREEGRFLVCSSCGYEWRFMRLKCPFCENENHEALRYFHTEKEGKEYRVDVCDKCKRYIKTVDIRELNTEIIPLLEDMSTLYLDILAQKEGYTREGKSTGLEVNA